MVYLSRPGQAASRLDSYRTSTLAYLIGVTVAPLTTTIRDIPVDRGQEHGDFCRTSLHRADLGQSRNRGIEMAARLGLMLPTEPPAGWRAALEMQLGKLERAGVSTHT